MLYLIFGMLLLLVGVEIYFFKANKDLEMRVEFMATKLAAMEGVNLRSKWNDLVLDMGRQSGRIRGLEERMPTLSGVGIRLDERLANLEKETIMFKGVILTTLKDISLELDKKDEKIAETTKKVTQTKPKKKKTKKKGK